MNVALIKDNSDPIAQPKVAPSKPRIESRVVLDLEQDRAKAILLREQVVAELMAAEDKISHTIREVRAAHIRVYDLIHASVG